MKSLKNALFVLKMPGSSNLWIELDKGVSKKIIVFKPSIKEGANCKIDLDHWVRIVPNMNLEVTNAVFLFLANWFDQFWELGNILWHGFVCRQDVELDIILFIQSNIIFE